MRRLYFCIIFTLLVFCCLVITGCYTVRTPYIADSYTPYGNYVILGRVTAKTRIMQSGYALLREQAAKVYPEADDVIHVQIDAVQNLILFAILKSYRYELSGLVIKYDDSLKASDSPLIKDEVVLEIEK